MKIESRLTKWVAAQVIDQAAADRILAFERDHTRFSFFSSAIWLGGFAIFLGIAAIIGSNWDEIPGWMKLVVHFAANAALAAVLFDRATKNRCDGGWLSEGLIAAYAGLTLTFIALLGQVYQTQAPAWQPLALWLALVSPVVLLLARTRAVLQAWIIALLATYVSYLSVTIGEFSTVARVLSISLLPLAAVAIGQLQVVRAVRTKAGEMLAFNGVVLSALMVSLAQLGWYSRADLYNLVGLQSLAAGGLVTLAATMLLPLARRRLLIDMPNVFDVFMVVSAGLAFLPLLLPHASWPVVAALSHMLYWGFCGWVAARTGYPNALRWAVRLIALRLVILYIEELGSLMQTGLGLIFSGVLLIGLVMATRAVVARFLPANGKGVAL